VSPVRHELGSYIPEDDILHSRCRETLRSFTMTCLSRSVAWINKVFACDDSHSQGNHLDQSVTPNSCVYFHYIWFRLEPAVSPTIYCTHLS
jgi:hypothetical protein